MNGFFEEIKGIYRLKVPFEGIYTSVFLIVTPQGALLVDCATTPYDVDNYIVLSLEAMGYGLTDIKAIVLTHRHGDHAGGLERILEFNPDIEVITGISKVFDVLSVYPMAGHTEDSVGVFDSRTGTLLSGDGLQGAGVDKYRCYTKVPDEYILTLERIKNDVNIENILFSHAYEPWNRDSAKGRENVLRCLEDCAEYVKR